MVLRSDCELGIEWVIMDLQLGLCHIQNAFKHLRVLIAQMCARFFTWFLELSMSIEAEVITRTSHTGKQDPGRRTIYTESHHPGKTEAWIELSWLPIPLSIH